MQGQYRIGGVVKEIHEWAGLQTAIKEVCLERRPERTNKVWLPGTVAREKGIPLRKDDNIYSFHWEKTRTYTNSTEKRRIYIYTIIHLKVHTYETWRREWKRTAVDSQSGRHQPTIEWLDGCTSTEVDSQTGRQRTKPTESITLCRCRQTTRRDMTPWKCNNHQIGMDQEIIIIYIHSTEKRR